MFLFFCEGKPRRIFFACLIVLFSGFNFHCSRAQSVAPTQKAGSRLSSPLLQPATQVQGLIVTPHRTRGGKLSAELANRQTARLSDIAELSLHVDRPVSGRSHLLKFERPVTIQEARAIAARLKSDSQIESAEPDFLMRIDSFTPADPGYATLPGQWHYMTPDTGNLGGANLPDAWSMTLGSASVNVAVLDTGYLPHADLAPMLPGHDFISNTSITNDGNARDSDARDPGDWVAAGECGNGSPATVSSWHGTHVTGTIAALMNNGVDGTGIAPNVRILPVRVMGKCGGYISDIVDAMRWAVGIDVPGVAHNLHPARIINMSLGSPGVCSAAFQSAVNDVNATGAIIVVASGNGAMNAVNQPANCSGVIAVTAHVVDGDNADYANVGPEIMISAPGGGCGTLDVACVIGMDMGRVVYSLGNTGTTSPVSDSYALKRGTSMAAPHVAGTIALMLSLNPLLTRAQIKSILRASARPHPVSSTCTLDANINLCGAGLLDAQAALTAIVPTIQIVQERQIVTPAATVDLSADVLAPVGRSVTRYQWEASTSNPVVIAIDHADTAHASFIAPATGNYVFTLRVTDSSGAVSNAIAIIKVNSAPVITAQPAQQIMVGQSMQLQLQANDADGDVPIFHASAMPVGASLSASGLFVWPNAAPAGNYQIAVYASDHDSTSTAAVLVVSVMPGTSMMIGGRGGGGSMQGDLTLLCGLIVVIRRRLKKPVHETI